MILKLLNKWLDLIDFLWKKLFPGRYKKWLEKQDYIFTHFDPDRISLNMVRIVCGCGENRAKQVMKLAVRRGEFIEHFDHKNNEKYWRVADWYKEQNRRELDAESRNKQGLEWY